jgi:hypothetical protein
MGLTGAATLVISAVGLSAVHASPAGAASFASAVPGGIDFDATLEQWYVHLPAYNQKVVMQRIAATGAKYLRVDIPMSGQEYEPGKYSWYVDTEVNQARAHGLKILGVLAFPSSWATQSNGLPNLSQFIPWVKTAVAHYKSSISVWEVWNEPNQGLRWPTGNVNVPYYVNLLKGCYTAIKSVQPGTASTVISGGLAPAANGAHNLSPLTFEKQMYADGAKGYFDAFADHPYSYPTMPSADVTWNPWTYLPTMHQIMASHGDGAKRIWYTEYGAALASAYGAVTMNQQAAEYTQAFQVARQWAWSGPLIAFEWRDSSAGKFGLKNNNGSPRPALTAFSAAARA